MKLKDFDFRLWHKPSKRFVDMSVRGADLRIIPADDDYNMELELWSGLCDKEGKRIYEGDIVAHVDKCRCIEYLSKVVFENGVFKYEYNVYVSDNNVTRKRLAVEIMQGTGDDCIVLGNIHENADLLKKEKELVLIKTKYSDMYDSKGFPKY